MSDTNINVVAILANEGELLKKAADEIEKLRAALKTARRDALEEAARVADKHAHGSDKKFAEVVRKSSAAGNSRIFDLAAASAAGMDHEARKIAAAIRALGEKE